MRGDGLGLGMMRWINVCRFPGDEKRLLGWLYISESAFQGV
jgi:hypothetical protein